MVIIIREQILLEASSFFEGKTDYVPNWTHPTYNPLPSRSSQTVQAESELCQQDICGTNDCS